MKELYSKSIKRVFMFLAATLIFSYGCKENVPYDFKSEEMQIVHYDSIQTSEIAVARPPFSDEYIFPCSECHAYQESNLNRRELVDMHDEISNSFNHDSENRWCLDCHNAENRDFLHLASGKLVSFEESYKLCGQCHGNKLRDWKVGVHGKRTGEWNGQKEYLLCVHCHNPHSPKFKQIKPLPPPIRQENIY
jgi:hypothetical protein